MTTTCPVWCTWADNENHIEGDLSVAGDDILRTHASTVVDLTIAGRPVGIDIIQEELTRGDVVELAPLMVYLGEVEPMTPDEARLLGAWLAKAADELDALR